MEDLEGFVRYSINKSEYLRKYRLTVLIGMFFVYMVFGIWGFLSEGLFGNIYFALILSALFCGCYLFVWHRANPKIAKRISKAMKSHSCFCKHELEIKSDGIHAKTTVETKLLFENIDRIQTRGSDYAYIASETEHFIIPRKGMLEGDLDAFITTLKEKADQSQSAK